METTVTRTNVWSELRITSAPHVSISISPHLTALAMIADALAGRRRGLPGSWRRAVQSQVSAPAREAVRPLAAPGYSVVPDSVVPGTAVFEASVQARVGMLRDIPPESLIKDLEQAFGPGPLPEHWRPAADRPDRWLHGYATALADVWTVTEPLWRRARPLLDREIERVGVASVRGGPEPLLGMLNDRIRYGERELLIADIESSTYELGERRIILVPMLAGRDAVIVSLDNPDAVWIAYPLPGAESLWHAPAAQALDELSALVGPVRAELLNALDRPMTMSMLASNVRIAPSGITYHCDRLHAARLISRERRGREVWIARTQRAKELLELFHG
ncbi:ArsR/SmtB family transcription factor [Nonomuraea lactucae]|uniref:ArsR/SmtB family transcription factor n=1 Tax=Nonomuraea lactucae TaxID=2249762 RepID=UPI0013B3C149|nr:winged helix-turn-helix domain-containing protein [Nonomuraea lactucae]